MDTPDRLTADEISDLHDVWRKLNRHASTWYNAGADAYDMAVTRGDDDCREGDAATNVAEAFRTAAEALSRVLDIADRLDGGADVITAVNAR